MFWQHAGGGGGGGIVEVLTFNLTDGSWSYIVFGGGGGIVARTAKLMERDTFASLLEVEIFVVVIRSWKLKLLTSATELTSTGATTHTYCET